MNRNVFQYSRMPKSVSLHRVAAPSGHAGYVQVAREPGPDPPRSAGGGRRLRLPQGSLARIAARAHVALGSVGYHVGSRDELLRELMTARMGDLLARLDAATIEAGPETTEAQSTGATSTSTS